MIARKALLVLSAAAVALLGAIAASAPATPATTTAAAAATGVTSTTAVTSATAVASSEPLWGRIYLRRGLAPIQYFRDRYGGPMVAREVEFYFPKRVEDRLGCELLPPDELDVVRAANESIVLVVDRGVCTFETKSRLAQSMGAAALVVVSEDESAKGPVALATKGEIDIASVMVRKSAGDMLRRAAASERVFGRLIPIVCQRKPYVCNARTAEESQYMDEQPARSGVVFARATNATLGDFIAATYGSVLPTRPITVPRDIAPIVGCGELDSGALSGHVAVFAATETGCTMLDKVSSAQRAGAVAALLAVGESPAAMRHPGVEQSWHAYNITIAAVVISSVTLEKLVALHQDEQIAGAPGVKIELHMRNRIAQVWDQVRQLSYKTAWPTRKDRQDRLLQRVVESFELDDRQLLELKRNYISVAGGSDATWDQAIAPTRRTMQHDADMPSEVVVGATGV